jgi:hypothetical protein
MILTEDFQKCLLAIAILIILGWLGYELYQAGPANGCACLIGVGLSLAIVGLFYPQN